MRVLCTTSSFARDEIHSTIEFIKNPYGRRLSESEVTGLINKYQPVGIISCGR